MLNIMTAVGVVSLLWNLAGLLKTSKMQMNPIKKTETSAQNAEITTLMLTRNSCNFFGFSFPTNYFVFRTWTLTAFRGLSFRLKNSWGTCHKEHLGYVLMAGILRRNVNMITRNHMPSSLIPEFHSRVLIDSIILLRNYLFGNLLYSTFPLFKDWARNLRLP